MSQRSLSAKDKRIMQELVEEHVTGRRTTQAVVVANKRYRNGDASALADISANLAKLVEFYPEHIQKEDKVFFPVIIIDTTKVRLQGAFIKTTGGLTKHLYGVVKVGIVK